MRTCGGCARHQQYSAARRLLGAALPPLSPSPASASPLDAQRTRLERALCATTAVLFVASVSYIALSTLFGCICAGRRPQRPDGEPGPPQAAAAAEGTTKRALDEIPVVVVQARDPDVGRGGEARVQEEQEEAGECAVCLAEYADGEEVRVLPACRHGFHRECVDRWLLTRAPTCPVCRAAVASRSERHDVKGYATGEDVLPLGPAVNREV